MSRKAQFYFDGGRKVHVSLNSGTFYNGYIKEMSADFFILVDDVLGELPVFFSEIKEDGLEPFNQKEEKEDGEV